MNTHSLDLELSSSQYAYILDASQTGLDITGNITIEAWIKLEQLPSTAGTSFMVVAKFNTTGNQRAYQFFIGSDDKLYMDWSQDGTGADFTRFNMDEAFVSGDLGTWIHIAAASTVATPTVAFYKNGTLKAGTSSFTDATAIFNSSATFSVGARVAGSNDGFADMMIDELRIWNDVRTGTEINNNKLVYGGFTVGVDNLVEIWHFDNNYNSLSGNNNLTASGSPTFTTDTPTGFESPSPSLSASLSISRSPSLSISLSPSLTPSASISPSPSISVSLSPSATPSLSISPSPSSGYSLYTRGDEAGLPGTDADLETTYTELEETKVSTRNEIRVGQTGTLEYMIHQFKSFVGSQTYGTIEIQLQSTLDPRYSTVYLQIYNRNSGAWQTVASNSTSDSDIDFELSAVITDLTNYKDASNIVSCRVYQLAI